MSSPKESAGSPHSSEEDERPLLECDVCLELYNESNRIPRCLSCNHTLCTSCIIQLLRRGPLKCPFCRTWHRGVVISAVDIPVQEELMSMVSEGSRKNDNGTADIFDQGAAEMSALNVIWLKAALLKAQDEGMNVYAKLLNSDGEARHARLSVHSDRLHLHSLTDNPPPDGSRIISYQTARALAEDSYQVVFFDITLDEVNQGKVYIRLLDDAGRTQQFLYFCTGEKGPSYTNTCFFKVTNKGIPGEQVWGGDYENNDGSGGMALPNMIRGPKNHQDVTAGLVAGFYYYGYGQDHSPSQFGIYVRDMPGYSEMSSIGKVLSGLDIVTSVANLNDVQSALVSECGLVLFH